MCSIKAFCDKEVDNSSAQLITSEMNDSRDHDSHRVLGARKGMCGAHPYPAAIIKYSVLMSQLPSTA